LFGFLVWLLLRFGLRVLFEWEVDIGVGEFDEVEVELEFLVEFEEVLFGLGVLVGGVFLEDFVDTGGDDWLFVFRDLFKRFCDCLQTCFYLWAVLWHPLELYYIIYLNQYYLLSKATELSLLLFPQ
jgi:hypothetical protein